MTRNIMVYTNLYNNYVFCLVLGAIFKILYGLEEQQVESAYSEWAGPEQFFDYPNVEGYKQNFDIVNSEGKPIGKAEEIVETYKTDDGGLGKELAALEQMEGKIGENGIFQGKQQTYEKGKYYTYAYNVHVHIYMSVFFQYTCLSNYINGSHRLSKSKEDFKAIRGTHDTTKLKKNTLCTSGYMLIN